MKNLLLATVALFAVSAPAFAADIPMSGEPSAPVSYIAPTAFNWTGPYIGAHVGYGFGGDFGAGLDGASGFVGGLQAGYNVQFDPMVLGIEAELAYSGIEDSNAAYDAQLNWRGSITPRFGIAMDRFLPYVKAGVAFGTVDANDALTSDSSTLWGWTAGVGVEYAVTNEMSVKVEYDYTDLGNEKFGLAGSPSIGYAGSEVKVGLNYHF